MSEQGDSLSQEEKQHEEQIKTFFDNNVSVARWWQGTNIDWLLQTLVNNADSEPGQFQPWISLTTAAGIISGHLISRKEYFEGLAEEMFTGELDEDGQKAKDSYIAFGETEPGSNASPAQFVHLRDSRLFTGSHTLPGDVGVLWRGKISSVIGFTYSGLIP